MAKNNGKQSLLLRLQYICEYCFSGDVFSFGKAIAFNQKQLRNCLSGNAAITPNLLAHIAQSLDINTDWLLCGRGNMYCRLTSLEPLTVTAPMHRLFKQDATAPLIDSPIFSTSCPRISTDLQAKEVQQAFSFFSGFVDARQPIVFFAGLDTFVCRQTVLHAFLEPSIAAGFCLTGSFLESEVTRAEKVTYDAVVRFGADAGIGLAESVQRWGCTSKRSLLRVAKTKNVPVFGFPLIGESVYDCCSPQNSFGCSVGATAQVDLVSFIAFLQDSFTPDGLVVFLPGSYHLFDTFLVSLFHAFSPSENIAGGLFNAMFVGTPTIPRRAKQHAIQTFAFCGSSYYASAVELAMACGSFSEKDSYD